MNICFPDFQYDAESPEIKNFKNNIAGAFSNPSGVHVTDLYLSSNAIYISMALAVIYLLCFVYLMSKLSHCMAWSLIVVT